MKHEISMNDVQIFQKKYRENSDNLILEEDIKKLGIKDACIQKEQFKNIQYHFNIEIPKVKIYNQKNSCQCHIYAFLRVVKSIMQRKGTDISCLNLSANYIEFYDKLEKANSLYNDLLSLPTIGLEIINEKVNQYIGNYGTFHFCRNIVNKYGLVPADIMGGATENYDARLFIELLKNKIKTDALSLIDLKIEKNEAKQLLMQEVYIFLSKTIGNPPTSFYDEEKLVTPLMYKEKNLKNDLDNFVTVTPFDKQTLYSSHSYIPNKYLNSQEQIYSLDIDQIKKMILQQLKENVAIWFSAEESTTLDYELNILDDRIYDFSNLLNIRDVSKREKILLDITSYDHAMCITGALENGGTIEQLKVDNSFGEHGIYKGNIIMTSSFLENNVITLIIDKKYLQTLN